jgi:hypothetical protein
MRSSRVVSRNREIRPASAAGALGAARVTLGELALHRRQRADDDDLLAVHR